MECSLDACHTVSAVVDGGRRREAIPVRSNGFPPNDQEEVDVCGGSSTDEKDNEEEAV